MLPSGEASIAQFFDEKSLGLFRQQESENKGGGRMQRPSFSKREQKSWEDFVADCKIGGGVGALRTKLENQGMQVKGGGVIKAALNM